ncbi:MAG TPA: hypothetical protein VN931_07805 [Fibrobacteria bacterium]|nr:hypothetical protein [Fibrobacteria bacterium]
MHDSVGLFKILVLVAVVGYQVVKAWRKKAKTQDPRPAGPVATESQPENSWWEPRPEPVLESQPVPEPLPSRETGSETVPIPAIRRGIGSTPPIAYKPISALSEIPADPTPRLPETILPELRDLVLAQVILSPPPGLRGGSRGGRSPLELRR